MPDYLDSFENYLKARDKTRFFVGNHYTLVDFVLYELFWQMTLMVPNSINESNRPILYAYIRSFEETPAIADYMKSKHFIERPINSPWASFA